MKQPGAEEFLPRRRTLPSLRKAVDDCEGCDLYRDATQAVFGAGPSDASLVLLGEQPGDVEDKEGEPFVGPAGRVLDRALEAAGLERADVYLTNAVKHFRFRERGKRRIHQSPSRTQVVACQPWFLAELEVLSPQGLVLMGSVAGQAVFGPDFRVGESRGKTSLVPDSDVWSVATIHPSAVLRADSRQDVFDGLVADLCVAAGRLR